MKFRVQAEMDSVRNSMALLERSAVASLRSDNEVRTGLKMPGGIYRMRAFTLPPAQIILYRVHK